MRPLIQPHLHDLAAKNWVRIVCMDLSESYRSIARSYFPSALVVADRFHVVRLALHHLMQTCRTIDPALTAIGMRYRAVDAVEEFGARGSASKMGAGLDAGGVRSDLTAQVQSR